MTNLNYCSPKASLEKIFGIYVSGFKMAVSIAKPYPAKEGTWYSLNFLHEGIFSAKNLLEILKNNLINFSDSEKKLILLSILRERNYPINEDEIRIKDILERNVQITADFDLRIVSNIDLNSALDFDSQRKIENSLFNKISWNIQQCESPDLDISFFASVFTDGLVKFENQELQPKYKECIQKIENTDSSNVLNLSPLSKAIILGISNYEKNPPYKGGVVGLNWMPRNERFMRTSSFNR